MLTMKKAGLALAATRRMESLKKHIAWLEEALRRANDDIDKAVRASPSMARAREDLLSLPFLPGSGR